MSARSRRRTVRLRHNLALPASEDQKIQACAPFATIGGLNFASVPPDDPQDIDSWRTVPLSLCEGIFRRRKRMGREPLRAELFREAVAIAADEAKREGRDISRLQVARIDAIIDELKKKAAVRGPTDGRA